MNMSILCAPCESAQVTLNHPNDNIIGYLGFALVVVMLIQDKVRKNKAKK